MVDAVASDKPARSRQAAGAMRGIDHLAFVTDDLAATLDFYTRVMQMPLVHVRRVRRIRETGNEACLYVS